MNEENKKTLAGIIIFAVVVIAVIIILLLRGCGAKEYKVTFDSNGGTAISEIIVKENETITKPADPTREGYVFVGWYYNDELFDFSTKITKDMVLEARWAEIDGDKITLNVTTLTLAVNEEGVIETTSLPEGVTEEDLIWSSSDESIVTVDENGNIKGLKEGKATITVTTKDGKYTATCEVTVAETVTELRISGASSVTVGSTIKLTANKKVTWKSSNPSIATVDENGNVKGLKTGTVTIIATTEDGETTTKTITVKAKPANVAATSELIPLDLTGGGIQYEYNVTKNGATFTDYLGFEYNGTKVVKNQGTVASTTVENGGSTAKLTLSDKTVVTATVVVR